MLSVIKKASIRLLSSLWIKYHFSHPQLAHDGLKRRPTKTERELVIIMQYRPQWPCSAMRPSCITWRGVMFLKSINSREYLITTFTLFYVYWFKILVSWDRCKFDKSGRWFCFFLFLAQYITGTCPEGFAPGTYGIGSCYIVHRELLQMAEAVIKCRDLYAARLLNIQSQQEDSFIKRFLLNTSSSGDMIFISVFIFASVAYNFHFLYISYHLFICLIFL